jgi:anti-anti-sigma regulatory factor
MLLCNDASRLGAALRGISEQLGRAPHQGESPRTLLVDLSQVESVSGAMIVAIANLARGVRGVASVRLVLRCNPFVQDLLEIAQLDRFIEIVHEKGLPS